MAVDKNGGRRTLTKGFHAEQGSYSPDGRLIACEQRSTADEHDVLQSNVIIARADGSDPQMLSMGTDPSWSPDGTSVMFKIWDAADRQLWITVASLDGTARRLAPGVLRVGNYSGRFGEQLAEAARNVKGRPITSDMDR